MRRCLLAAFVAAVAVAVSADRASAQYFYQPVYPVYGPVVYPTVPVVGSRALVYNPPVYSSRSLYLDAPVYSTRSLYLDSPTYVTRSAYVEPAVTYTRSAYVEPAVTYTTTRAVVAPATVVAPVYAAPAVVVRGRGIGRSRW